jgi:hypothetical protein
MSDVAEKKRLDEARAEEIPWKKWGSYLRERLFGLTNSEANHGEDVRVR